MNRPSKTRALLATLRIANAPSVVSNVWLGYMVGWTLWIWPDLAFGEARWVAAATLAAAGLLLYFSGNLANDWFDRKWDETRRPERALPAGLFPPAAYLVMAIAAAAGGIALSFAVHPASGACAAVIVALIALYTRYHKQAAWSVVPMGLCRAGLYALGFAASWPENYLSAAREGGFDPLPFTLGQLLLIATLALGLFCYIAGLSLSARYESMPDPPQGPRVISWALLAMPVLAMSCHLLPAVPLFGVIGLLPFILWLALCCTIFRKPLPRYVSALLAGIPLVDFIAAAPIALYADGGLLEGKLTNAPHLTALLLIPPGAFVLGRLLQKIAPAT